MGIFFRDDDDNDEEEYTGQTGDPLRDAIYGWDMGSGSSYNGDRYRQDDNRRNGNAKHVPLKRDFEDIPFREFSSYVKRLIISPSHMNNIINSFDVNPQNCTFSIHQNDDIIGISLVLKNEYMTFEFNCTYHCNNSEFTIPLPSQDYRNLESMQWFKNEVRRVEKEIGLKFDSEAGGYHYQWIDEKLKITDEFQILVYFSDDDRYSDSYSYKVDFKNKKLEKYHVHSWIELSGQYL